MTTRRQAFRREPIEVELAPGEFFLVEPIPWEQRTMFGNELVRQHVEILNDAVKIYVDEETGTPQLEAKLSQKFTDPGRLFETGLLPEAYQKTKTLSLYHNQVVEILLAICDVNDFPQLKAMIDPNLTTPTKLSGLLSSLILPSGEEDTQKTESGQDSSPQDSTESQSENSPTLSSVPS